MGGAHLALVFQVQEERGCGPASREVRQGQAGLQGRPEGRQGLLMLLLFEDLQTRSRNPDALAGGGGGEQGGQTAGAAR